MLFYFQNIREKQLTTKCSFLQVCNQKAIQYNLLNIFYFFIIFKVDFDYIDQIIFSLKKLIIVILNTVLYVKYVHNDYSIMNIIIIF